MIIEQELRIPKNYRDKLKKTIVALVENIGEDTSEIWLFGSCSRGEVKLGSDIDLLVIPISDDKDERRKLSLKVEMTDLRDDIAEIPVDIIVRRRSFMNDLSGYFQQNVFKDHKVLWRNDNEKI